MAGLRTRGAAVVVVGMLVACRESAAPSKPDASADASASADADANADANADASADAEVSADASASADATTTASGDAGAKDGGAGRVVRIDETGDGKTFDVADGTKIVLHLSASPTSGFDWSVIKAPKALGTPEMGYVAPAGDAMGAPGKRRITWIVKGALPAGESAVELGYRRGFEQGTPPLKTFRFKVRGTK